MREIWGSRSLRWRVCHFGALPRWKELLCREQFVDDLGLLRCIKSWWVLRVFAPRLGGASGHLLHDTVCFVQLLPKYTSFLLSIVGLLGHRSNNTCKPLHILAAYRERQPAKQVGDSPL